jgi:hypothetical protein
MGIGVSLVADFSFSRPSASLWSCDLELRGSPTVLVNGQDPFLDRESAVELSCRVYRTEDGLSGSPAALRLIGVLGEAPPPLDH